MAKVAPQVRGHFVAAGFRASLQLNALLALSACGVARVFYPCGWHIAKIFHVLMLDLALLGVTQEIPFKVFPLLVTHWTCTDLVVLPLTVLRHWQGWDLLAVGIFFSFHGSCSAPSH